MQNFTITLLLAGILAGFINFFTNYVVLPFSPAKSLSNNDSSELKNVWWIALIGYLLVGCAGAFLTPLLNAIIGNGLKGLELTKPDNKGIIKPIATDYIYILFGYGLVFGYSTTRLLVTLLDSLSKKISIIETRVNELRLNKNNLNTPLILNETAAEIINECESQFQQYKDDCSGFVKAVASAFDFKLTGQADSLVDQIQQPDWLVLSNGLEAKEKADNGWLVIAGLKSYDNEPPQTHGHVVIIVSGPIQRKKYPSGYWGSLNGSGEKFKTINWAWNSDSRDKVIYAAKAVKVS